MPPEPDLGHVPPSLADFVAACPEAAILVGADGRLVAANPAAATLLGFPAAALAGMPIASLVAGDDGRAWIDGVLAGTTWQGEMDLRDAGGDLVPVDGWAVAVPGDDAPVAVVVLRDALPRRRERGALADATDRAARLRALLEHAPSAAAVLDAAGRIAFATPAFSRLLGGGASGSRPLARVHPNDRDAVRSLFAPLVSKPGPPATLEACLPGPDGEWRRVELTLENMLTHPAVRGVVVHARDITEHRRAEAAAQAAERRTREILEALTDGFVAFDRDWQFVDANTAAELVLGHARRDLLGRRLWEVFPEANEPPFRSAFEQAMAARAAVRIEEFFPPLGAWFEVSAYPTVDGLSVFFRDVTERRNADTDRAHLAAIVESSEAAISSATLDGRVLTWNAGAERMYGRSAGEMVGHDIRAIVPPDRTGEVDDMLAALAQGRVLRLETVRVTRDGRRLDVALTASPLRDPDGQVVGGSFIAHDVTARKLAEAELRAAKAAAEEADHLKSTFLRTVSHELRTPLTAILGYAELLRGGFADPLTPMQAADIGQIAAGATRLLGLIDNLLDMSRFEAGALEIRPRFVDVAGLVADVAEELFPLAAAKGIDLAVDAPPGLAATADPDRLRQVLVNLAGNAVKFTEAGSVTIAARAAGGGVEVSVADTGIGIPPAALPFVFDEFRQADERTTRTYGGSGLGLAIAKKLVEAHGGAIRAESAPGAGSTFTVTLPVHR